MAFLKAVRVERSFISLGTSSQIFGTKGESDSVPCEAVRTGPKKKMDLFLMLHIVMFSLNH